MTPFGAELRVIRSRLRITLKEYAGTVGVTPAYLSALERGHRGVPTSEMLDRIVYALNVTQEEERKLFDLMNVSRPKVSIDTANLEPEATELANVLAANIDDLRNNQLTELLNSVHAMIASNANREPDT